MITKSLFQLASAFWVIHDITNIGSTYLRKKANECNHIKTQYYYIFNVFTHHLILVVRKKRSQNDKEKSIAIFQVPFKFQLTSAKLQSYII